MTITRQQYLNNTKLHKEYYAQFVTEEIKQLVLRRFGIEKLCAAYEEDTELNNIPLVNWDGLGVHLMHGSRYLDRQLVKETGQGYSNAGAVCILKEAARQLVEEYLDDVEYKASWLHNNYKSLEDIQKEDPDNIVIFHSQEYLDRGVNWQEAEEDMNDTGMFVKFIDGEWCAVRNGVTYYTAKTKEDLITYYFNGDMSDYR